VTETDEELLTKSMRESDDKLAEDTPTASGGNETGNPVFNKEQVRFVFKKAWFVCLNLCLVYFFEYVIITCFVDRATIGHESGDFWHRNSFMILQFCY
jgi:hypothetical protein